jgi:hypothetical protein
LSQANFGPWAVIGSHPPRTSVSKDALACFETSVGLFEHASGSLTVGTMLKQGQRVPLAPLGAEKVSATTRSPLVSRRDGRREP